MHSRGPEGKAGRQRESAEQALPLAPPLTILLSAAEDLPDDEGQIEGGEQAQEGPVVHGEPLHPLGQVAGHLHRGVGGAARPPPQESLQHMPHLPMGSPG